MKINFIERMSIYGISFLFFFLITYHGKVQASSDRAELIKMFAEGERIDQQKQYDNAKNLLLSYQNGTTVNEDTELYHWTVRAIEAASLNDILRDQQIFNIVSSKLFGKAYFSWAAEINIKILDKLCKSDDKKIKKGSYYKNAITLYLAAKDFNLAADVFQKKKICFIEQDYQQKARISLLGRIDDIPSSADKWTMIKEIIDFDVLTPFAISALGKVYQQSLLVSDKKKAQIIKQFIKDYFLRHQKHIEELDVEDIEVYADLQLQDLNGEIVTFKNKKINLDSVSKKKELPKLLVERLDALRGIEGQLIKVAALGAPRITFKTYKILAEQYKFFADEIRENRDSENEKNLIEIERKLQERVSKLTQEQTDLSLHNDILFTNDNYDILNNEDIPLQGELPRGHLMDFVPSKESK